MDFCILDNGENTNVCLAISRLISVNSDNYHKKLAQNIENIKATATAEGLICSFHSFFSKMEAET